MRVEIGGRAFRLETAAVSCLRYRATYGESVVNHLSACTTARELERLLLRLCHMMIPPVQRPGLTDFAALARRDGDFVQKALEARAALLAPDPRDPGAGDAESDEPFDEYTLLVLLALSGLDLGLIYELPVLHLVSMVNRVSDLKDTEKERYRPMTGREMALLYPGRK